MSKRVEGKTALVVGAGSSGPGWGNGKAAAVLYAREGARVLAVDRDRSSVEETARLIEQEGGICESFVADVTSASDMQAMAQGCIDAFGRIDILHNNVGMAITGGAVETNEEDWDRMVAVNQTGLFLAYKHVLPHMERQRRGAIVTIGSVAALQWVGFPYLAYTATKAAVWAMTRNVALQYASLGIRANCVLPGFLDTPMIREPLADEYGGDVEEMIGKRDRLSPTGRMGDAWDTAYAALFLASDEARYVNGTQIVVDGGLSARCVS